MASGWPSLLLLYLGRLVKVTDKTGQAGELSLVTNQFVTRAPPTRDTCHVTRHNQLCEARARVVKSSKGIKIAVVWP